MSEQNANDYPVACDDCEGHPNMELKGAWISKYGMRFSLYQCEKCKEIIIYTNEVSE